MHLEHEQAYGLHELRIELGNAPHVEAYLVDDRAGQALALSGEPGRVDLTCRGLWDAPIGLEELRLEPGSRDVAAVALLRDHTLRLEVTELHSHYRRLHIYEQWMKAAGDADADRAEHLPAHLHLRRVWASVALRQLELELGVGDARQLVVLRGVAALDLRVDARNRNTFAHEVAFRPIAPATREALLEASATHGPQRRALDARLAGLRELRLMGQDVELTALLRV